MSVHCAADRTHRGNWFKGGRHFEDTWFCNTCKGM